MRVLIIEDSETLAQGIRKSLRDAGHAVDLISDGADGDLFLRTEKVDVAIIDLNLPNMEGTDIIRTMRSRGDSTPVLILTAQTQTAERVRGLDSGADDYLTKPFDMAELLARVRALGRRREAFREEIQQLGLLTFNRGSMRLEGPNGAIDLPRRELALFEVLLNQLGRLATRDFLLDQLYGTGAETEPNAIELLVSRLRRKLENTGVLIRTVRGLGYMLDQDERT